VLSCSVCVGKGKFDGTTVILVETFQTEVGYYDMCCVVVLHCMSTSLKESSNGIAPQDLDSSGEGCAEG